jgi:hypothetical protein
VIVARFIGGPQDGREAVVPRVETIRFPVLTTDPGLCSPEMRVETYSPVLATFERCPHCADCGHATCAFFWDGFR